MADASNDLEEHGMVRTLKDLFAGAAGGIAQVLLGELLSLFLETPSQLQLLQFQFLFLGVTLRALGSGR
jgi:hypothetical protein